MTRRVGPWLAIPLLGSALVLCGCRKLSPPAPPAPMCSVQLTPSSHDLDLAGNSVCPGEVALDLRVAVGDAGAPTWFDPAGAPVEVSGTWSAKGAFAERTVTVSNPGTAPVELVGLEWTAANVPGSPSWMLHNGYQSWGYTGITLIPSALTDSLGTAPHGGDNENVLAEITGVSWWWTSLINSQAQGVTAGAEGGTVFKTYLAADGERLRIVQGVTGDSLTLAPGASVDLDGLFLGLGPVADRLADYSGRVAALHPPSVARHPALGGWGSWNIFYGQETAASVGGEMDWVASNLEPLGLSDLLLDDGYEVHWGDWVATAAFGADLGTWASDVVDAGLSPAIWLAPLYVDTTDPMVVANPEWFVHQADGSLRTYSDPGEGTYAALDVSSAGARNVVTSAVTSLSALGYQTLKIDFLFGGAIEGIRQQPLTSLQSYQQWMQVIRQAVPGVHLVGCGAPLLASAGWVDSMRTGSDIAYSVFPGPEPGFLAAEARQTILRSTTDSWWSIDPDVLLLRGTDISDAQAWTAVLSWALSGGNALLGDGKEASALRLSMALAPEVLGLARDGAAARPDDWSSGYDREVIETPPDDLMGDTAVPHAWRKVSADGTRHALAIFGWQSGASVTEAFPAGAEEILRPTMPGPLVHQAISGITQVDVDSFDARFFLW